VAGTFRVTVQPPVHEGQRVGLLLNERLFPESPPRDTPPRAYSVVAPPIGLTSPSAPTPVIDIPFTGVAAGEYLVRIAVDGAESPLGVDANGAYDAPTVVVP
jgi:hypothetical protein